MTTVWHLTDPDTWAAALSRGAFAESTRGASIAQVGFLHGSYTEQLALVTRFVYRDVTGPMVALGIEPGLLPKHGLELRDEPGAPGDPTLYPHVYGGDLPLAVITDVVPVTVVEGVLVGWPPPARPGP